MRNGITNTAINVNAINNQTINGPFQHDTSIIKSLTSYISADDLKI